uniref:Uncharacterized protein n=1 Tax=Solanum tuberosum TaxID=4113 RepID=M1DP99_SOLTU
MTHLLQRMTQLLDTCPEPKAYPTCKSIVVTDESSVALGKPSVKTDESSGAADDSSVAINDLSIGTSFWFNPSLICYVICSQQVSYLLQQMTYLLGMKIGLIAAVQCEYQLKKKKMMNNQKKMVTNKKKKNDEEE